MYTFPRLLSLSFDLLADMPKKLKAQLRLRPTDDFLEEISRKPLMDWISRGTWDDPAWGDGDSDKISDAGFYFQLYIELTN